MAMTYLLPPLPPLVLPAKLHLPRNCYPFPRPFQFPLALSATGPVFFDHPTLPDKEDKARGTLTYSRTQLIPRDGTPVSQSPLAPPHPTHGGLGEPTRVVGSRDRLGGWKPAAEDVQKQHALASRGDPSVVLRFPENKTPGSAPAHDLIHDEPLSPTSRFSADNWNQVPFNQNGLAETNDHFLANHHYDGQSMSSLATTSYRHDQNSGRQEEQTFHSVHGPCAPAASIFDVTAHLLNPLVT
ncbi:uncharacterized protein PGTG_15266 [Puccinia graminis f. sp. tritici CRL 75-36-700-3]|uniref:Uncharacterized protein n=1 Tax=Puccinia graminis f. sp. tritici (strain CRL 75-36-700-3 / race SCCL) TaxID=418459 RepID=E3KYM8_PUCGT|nr:uncharacterized protein PGTG_15266 [Puccinia graminis f. sp. tritici CRL 75-36-700-3]EFP89424.2 hypothetical protein PGTG_15266 [Puccinia graminis f. sp. tritici CRL 75-36-700-3]